MDKKGFFGSQKFEEVSFNKTTICLNQIANKIQHNNNVFVTIFGDRNLGKITISK